MVSSLGGTGLAGGGGGAGGGLLGGDRKRMPAWEVAALEAAALTTWGGGGGLTMYPCGGVRPCSDLAEEPCTRMHSESE